MLAFADQVIPDPELALVILLTYLEKKLYACVYQLFHRLVASSTGSPNFVLISFHAFLFFKASDSLCSLYHIYNDTSEYNSLEFRCQYILSISLFTFTGSLLIELDAMLFVMSYVWYENGSYVGDCYRPSETCVVIKIFICRRDSNGRESRIKFYSCNHSDRVSQTVPDNVLSVDICRVHDPDSIADSSTDRYRSYENQSATAAERSLPCSTRQVREFF